MRVLVTGATGFVGRHVVAELGSADCTVIRHGDPATASPEDGPCHYLDLRDAEALGVMVADIQPDACIHLAGIAFIPDADSHPEYAFEVNTLGTIGLLQACRTHAPTARILAVSSAQVYGHPDLDRPIREDDPLRPYNLYSVSKTAADQAALLFAEQFGLHVMTARPCNHVGPGQSPRFATSSFSRQLLEISRGDCEPVIRVGNLASRRDFLDVRDVARAYRLLLESGRPGRAYNIGSGKLVRIESVLDELCRQVGVSPERHVDPALFRPTDDSIILDTRRIRDDTGWTPSIPLHTTLRDILKDVRIRPHTSEPRMLRKDV